MAYGYFRPNHDSGILQEKTKEIDALKETVNKLTEQLKDFEEIKGKLQAAE